MEQTAALGRPSSSKYGRIVATASMTGYIFVIAFLPMLLVAAAIFDLASFAIPNILPAAMLVLFAVFLIAMAIGGHPLSWSQLSQHLLAGGVGLAAGMALFAAGWIGGGDAKLFAMASLWLGWDAMYEYSVIASLLGGMLTLGLLMFRRFPLPPLLAAQPWLLRLADREAGVPYGVALAIAALNVLPDTEIFRLVAAS